MPPRACIRCGADALPGTSRCQEHTRSNWSKHKATSPHQAYYRTGEWKRRRAAQLKAQPTCERCGAPATHADHVTNMAAGGDPSGPLQSLCAPCHQSKTGREGHDARFR